MGVNVPSLSLGRAVLFQTLQSSEEDFSVAFACMEHPKVGETS